MRVAIFLLFISPFTCFAQKSAKDILLHASKSMSIRSSIDYTAETYFKFFSSDDTMQFGGLVQLKKDATDTIFGGYIKYTTENESYKFYDLHGIYVVDRKRDTVERFAPHRGEYWAMTGNIKHRMVLSYFLSPETLKKNISENNKLKLLQDTIIQGKDCYQIQIDYPDNQDYKNSKMLLCITKTDKVPIYKKHTIMFQGDYQYYSLLLKDYQFDSTPKSSFSIDVIDRNFPVDTFKAKERKRVEPLKDNIQAPLLTGNDPLDNMKELIPTLTGKVTVLDFWYMSCPPCIRAIPVLEEIHEKYSTSGLQIIGVNILDNDEKNLKRLPKFLSYNPIKYQILMADIKTKEDYHIQAWPTFYIIDQNGQVAYSRVGFLDDTGKEMTTVIDKLLNRQ